MSKEILVSVICTAYNHEKYIEKAIKGFIMQKTSFSYEILIHEDASTDKTAEIIKKYEELYPNLIKVIYQKENQYSQHKSPSKYLFDLSKGKYLAFCEGDDYWIDDYKLQKQVNFLENNNDYYATYHNVLVVDENNQVKKDEQKSYSLYDTHTVTLNDKLFVKMIGQTASILCRNFWKTFNEKEKQIYLNCLANGDKKIAFICAAQGKIKYFKEIMSCYRRTYTGDSWNARTKNKNLSIFTYNSIIALEKMIEEIFSKKFDYKIHLKEILISSFKYFLKNPTKKNLSIFYELYKRSKVNILFFSYLFSKNVLVYMLRKLGIIKVKSERPILKEKINLEGKKNL